MDRKYLRLALMLAVYFFVFWIGFKTGSVHTRMKNKIELERIIIPKMQSAKERFYYIVEQSGEGDHRNVTYRMEDETHPILQFFLNEKLKPLLKRKHIEIYDVKGERIY